MRLLPTIAALINAVVILAEPCRAQMPGNFASVPQRELVVGTKQTPPFAMKNADDSWSGISIDLWRHVADEQHLRYRFAEEPTVQALIDGVTAGRFDIAVAALTVTAARAQTLDFTQPLLRYRAWDRRSGRRRAKLAAHYPYADLVRLCPSDHSTRQLGAGRRNSRLGLRTPAQ